MHILIPTPMRKKDPSRLTVLSMCTRGANQALTSYVENIIGDI